MGDLREGPTVYLLQEMEDTQLPSRISPWGHINTQAQKPGPLWVPSAFTPGTSHHRSSHCQDVNYSLSPLLVTDFSPFAKYDCQEHTHFPSFSGTEKMGTGSRTVSAKDMLSLLLPIERCTRNTAGIDFPLQVFTPRYRISEQGRMSVKIRKGCSVFSSSKHLPHHLLQWQGTGLLMLTALGTYLFNWKLTSVHFVFFF